LVEPSEALEYANWLWKLLQDGSLKIKVFKEYPFSVEGLAQTSTDQTSRGTVGKLLVKVAA